MNLTREDASLIEEAMRNSLGVYGLLKRLGVDKELPGYDHCLKRLQKAIDLITIPPPPEGPPLRVILEPQGYRVCHRKIRDGNCRRLMGHEGECVVELPFWRAFFRQVGVK